MTQQRDCYSRPRQQYLIEGAWCTFSEAADRVEDLGGIDGEDAIRYLRLLWLDERKRLRNSTHSTLKALGATMVTDEEERR